jgi:hypothetical protein
VVLLRLAEVSCMLLLAVSPEFISRDERLCEFRGVLAPISPPTWFFCRTRLPVELDVVTVGMCEQVAVARNARAGKLLLLH